MLDLTEPGGEKLRDALRRVGGDPDRLDQAKRGDLSAFLELHIEQGIVLESQSLDVGIVTSIVGIRRIEIMFQGEADHAGTTPMALRHDALAAAAGTVVSVRRVAEQLAAEGADYFVATVGILDGRSFGVQHRPGKVSARHRRADDGSGTDGALYRDRRSRESGACGRRAGHARVLYDLVRRTHRWLAIRICVPRCVGARTISALTRPTCPAAPVTTRGT